MTKSCCGAKEQLYFGAASPAAASAVSSGCDRQGCWQGSHIASLAAHAVACSGCSTDKSGCRNEQTREQSRHS